MKNSITLKPIAVLPVLLIACFAAKAGTLQTYDVSLQTATLTGTSFYLDFQFVNGDIGETFANNSAALGGSSAFAGFNLQDGFPPFTGERILPFTAGAPVSFSVALTTNVDAGPTPDLFALYLLDQNLNNVATTDPSGADTVVSLTESTDPANPGLSLASYDTSSGSLRTTLTQAAVPEPPATILGGLCLLVPLARKCAQYFK